MSQTREIWPGFEVTDAAFAEYVRARVPPGDEKALSSLHAADLYLACACALGRAEAHQALERALFPSVRRALARVAGLGDVDDVLQSLREYLLVPRDSKPPGIVKYSGKGKLESWLRVLGVRLARRRLLRGTKPRAPDTAVFEALTSVDDPELLCVAKHCLADVSQCFNDAVATLTARQRTFLRHRYHEGLTVEQIGRLYDLHKSNVSRFLDETRRRLLVNTRKLLRDRLRIGTATMDSILRLIGSRLESFPALGFSPASQTSLGSRR